MATAITARRKTAAILASLVLLVGGIHDTGQPMPAALPPAIIHVEGPRHV